MTFDLGRAMLKKEERESARLMDFEFRHRARTWKLVAEAIGSDADRETIVALIARMDDKAILEELAARFPDHAPRLDEIFATARAEARMQLIKERGNPAPHRLA